MCALPDPASPAAPKPRNTPVQWIGLAVLLLLLALQMGLLDGSGLFGRGPEFYVPFLVAIVLAVTVHEFSHAWVATLFGDGLPRRLGRLTLNPLAHLDPIGSLLFLVAQFGWGKPVPINPAAMRNPSLGWALSSVAGPVSNVVAAAAGALIWNSGLLTGADRVVRVFVLLFILLNVSLAVFNLVPLPPLDGFGFLFGLAPQPLKIALLPLQTVGPWVLLALVFLPRLIPGAPPILGTWMEVGNALLLDLLGVRLRGV